MPRYTAQITRGVALLDARMPGWLDRIDIDRLDMSFGAFSYSRPDCGCVLAQVNAMSKAGFGLYGAGLRALGLTGGEDMACGFALPFLASERDWPVLTAEWAETIRQLRAERAAPSPKGQE